MVKVCVHALTEITAHRSGPLMADGAFDEDVEFDEDGDVDACEFFMARGEIEKKQSLGG